MPGRSHYDVLGVPSDASSAQIRDAFRALARDHHPDRPSSAATGGRTMPEINEAYRVLGDPARRAVYDASLRPAGRSAATSAPSAGEAPAAAPPHLPMPARFPWRGLAFFGVLAIIGVIVLAQFSEPPAAPRPDGITRVGDCVDIGPDARSFEVACTGDPAVDLVVEAFVGFDGTCPFGTEPHQDRQGMGIACVARP